LSAVWSWLGSNSDEVQAASSVVFGIAASLIAWFAYRVSVRQNFGWRPFTVLSGYSNCGDGTAEMNVEFQLWKRHCYPIVVYDIILSYHLARFKTVNDLQDPMSEAWTVRSEHSIGKWVSDVLGPASNKTFDMYMVVDAHMMMEAPTIEVHYLDTIANKVRKIRTVGETFSKLTSDYGWRDGLLIYLWPELRRGNRYRQRVYADAGWPMDEEFQKMLNEFKQKGAMQVRADLAAKRYGDRKRDFAEMWLGLLKEDEDRALKQQELDIARRSADASERSAAASETSAVSARTSAIWAGVSAIVATAALIISIWAALHGK
jgi:hypothetical protein